MTAQERASLWLDTSDQWAAPEGSGASVESSESRPPYDLESDPMFREPWPMPGSEVTNGSR